MTKHLQVYKCEVCGNIVEVVHAAAGTLVCCGKKMVLQEPGTVDASLEKHVPVIEKTDGGVKVKVGSVAHPMEEKHYIEWIEVIADGRTCRRFLKPGDAPEVMFRLDADSLGVRAYCNVHGLWQA